MNNKLSFHYLILIIALFSFGCGGSLTGQNKGDASAGAGSLHIGDERYFIIDTKQSVVVWKGTSALGGHDGYAYISNGELMIENGQLRGGKAEIDMKRTEGPGHDKDNNLINNLKGPDFFDVKKHPLATIAITKVEPISGEDVKISADLTIKGITHPVTFPAYITIKDGIVKANAKLIIDRTNWGIRYRSGKFFDDLKNQVIADDVEFKVDIVAKKQ